MGRDGGRLLVTVAPLSPLSGGHKLLRGLLRRPLLRRLNTLLLWRLQEQLLVRLALHWQRELLMCCCFVLTLVVISYSLH